MNKKLDTNIIANELEGSAFFPERKNDPVLPVRVVPPVRPVPSSGKRIMKQRHPFDIYQDQYDTLKQLALEERREGGAGSMSAIVREAIDKIVADRRRK